MKIESKFNIGDKVWLVIPENNHKELEVFTETITEISVKEDGIYYWLGDTLDDYLEEELIDYNDKEKLIGKIYSENIKF